MGPPVRAGSSLGPPVPADAAAELRAGHDVSARRNEGGPSPLPPQTSRRGHMPPLPVLSPDPAADLEEDGLPHADVTGPALANAWRLGHGPLGLAPPPVAVRAGAIARGGGRSAAIACGCDRVGRYILR